MGEINVNFKVKTELFYEKLPVFRKNKTIVHDLLIGMTILKFFEISFVERNIRFRTPQVKKKAPLKSQLL